MHGYNYYKDDKMLPTALYTPFFLAALVSMMRCSPAVLLLTLIATHWQLAKLVMCITDHSRIHFFSNFPLKITCMRYALACTCTVAHVNTRGAVT